MNESENHKKYIQVYEKNLKLIIRIIILINIYLKKFTAFQSRFFTFSLQFFLYRA